MYKQTSIRIHSQSMIAPSANELDATLTEISNADSIDQQDSLQLFTESTITITEHTDVCANWTMAKEAALQECTTDAHTTVKCFGGMSNINMSLPPMEDTEKLILCGWPSNNFDAPAVLRHFPNLEILHIEHSDNLTYFEKDFPEELHKLKVYILLSIYVF